MVAIQSTESLPPLFFFVHYFSLLCCFPTVLERDTCHLQVPKGNDARKKGWKDVVSASAVCDGV